MFSPMPILANTESSVRYRDRHEDYTTVETMDTKRTTYKASKPKPTPSLPALRKHSVSPQHSKLEKCKEDSAHRQWC
jgi:hypothetical protein